MKTSALFTQTFAPLELLPEKPKVFWYASSGRDFFPSIFQNCKSIYENQENNNKFFLKPDLFVYSCLGNEVNKLRELLQNDNSTLFENQDFIVTGKNYYPLSLQNVFNYEVSPDHIELSYINIPEIQDSVFYFEVDVKTNGYSETQRFLFFEWENIHFFHEILIRFFEVIYFHNRREGLGFGNCLKSIIEFIYQDNAPNFLIDGGFKPKFAIIDHSSSTFEIFFNAVINSQLISLTSNYGVFPSMINGNFGEGQIPDCKIFKLEYPYQP
ncbi:MAG: hypothetical protein GX102_03745 [Porphyromonadaceae bacterium]|jgi:hypothetical protein|nr:hypothetical protein [Porphyromonadaceae bacterium]